MEQKRVDWVRVKRKATKRREVSFFIRGVATRRIFFQTADLGKNPLFLALDQGRRISLSEATFCPLARGKFPR
jgi:hypothetical protein